MDIKTLATILLLGHMVSVAFMTMVIIRQLALFKLSIQAALVNIRKRLFTLSLVVLLGNVVPIFLDIATILSPDNLGRVSHPSIVGTIYTISNCMTSIISSVLIWTIYRMAAQADVFLKKS